MSTPRWLTTLTRLRRHHRDECRRQFQEAQQAAAVLGSKQAAIDGEFSQTREIRRAAAQTGACDVNRLLDAQRHQHSLQLEHQVLQEQIELVSAEAERRHAVFIDAEQQLRALERLTERKEQEDRRLADRQETKRLDELASLLPRAESL